MLYCGEGKHIQRALLDIAFQQPTCPRILHYVCLGYSGVGTLFLSEEAHVLG